MPKMKKDINSSFTWDNLAWNLWCICSIIGIWPRFIEPNLLAKTHKTLPISNLPKELDGLKILHLSDLHLNENSSLSIIKKLLKHIRKVKPDIIVFTGDFLCNSKVSNKNQLVTILKAMSAPHGCYAIMGNHDYKEYVSVNDQGDYDLITSKTSPLRKGWKRIFRKSPKLTKKITASAEAVQLNSELLTLLNETPFKVLHNENVLVKINNASLNICGVGEYTLGKCLPEKAFKNYEKSSPGIVLTHNPDSIPILKNYPGDLILCGHTHGGQVNLPWLCEKFMLVENHQFKRGLLKLYDKWIYINRGLGSVMFFRWFSMPEMTVITLKKVNSKR